MFPLLSLNCATHLLLFPATTGPSQSPCLKQSPFQPHFMAIGRLCECGWRIKHHSCHHTEKGLGEADAGSHFTSHPSSVAASRKVTWGREDGDMSPGMLCCGRGAGVSAWTWDVSPAASMDLCDATGEMQPGHLLCIPRWGTEEERKPWPALEQW